VSEITDTGYTRRQYGTESSLETRRSVWRDSPDGRNPATLAADAVRTEHPSRILEVGCGTGVFATRLCSENLMIEAVLRRHFGEVTVERIDIRAVFDDHAAAVAYLSSFDATMAERLPWFEGGREYTGTPTVFLAR
jgi:hypothetical protein